MNAIKFIKDHGVEKAREVLEGAPDKTATHYVADTDTYFSEEFHTYFDHSLNDWETADLHCVSDLEANYEFVLDVSDLKRLVESVDLVESYGGIINAKHNLILLQKHLNNTFGYVTIITSEKIENLEQAIADYESIYVGG